MEAFVLSTLLIFADCLQTREIARNDRYTESNFLGPSPSMGSVNAWCIGYPVVNGLIGFNLPKKCRKYWFGSVSVVSGVTVYHNYSIGVRF